MVCGHTYTARIKSWLEHRGSLGFVWSENCLGQECIIAVTTADTSDKSQSTPTTLSMNTNTLILARI